ncbi:putative transcriptional regulatory protein [bacterium BMS3Abin07]|nr:putative transcriptional regulatory protein [bacterium BMS3Abin07]GBE33414.1 putative transcriptional regulatory protein [bacterium BMS3Bbin05]HDL19720.1 YebC/PmpR family DNA-binding transcriptional regulator [Nitrospirota bacterium]HDO21240.1 YebC/PmpR family DNA-binding transcriptional regulator [Nitrospirota bacterium]HDZ87547.1 YebC/PmpR family DNA-binding transcriptional regulator [Nitrospirota bacterium]
MSGHSKWAQIKRKKASTDAKRGKVFSKLVKEIAIAARLGGGDPDGNPRLRTAMDKAKEANMPHDNIKKAIQKGTGELPGTSYEEFVYEGYGPGGVALMVEVLTDNKNRTVSELRHLMSKHGGNMGEAGCVAWMFDKKGYILVNKNTMDEETLIGIVLDAGAEDLESDPGEENYEIITLPEDFVKVRDALSNAGVKIEMAEITMIPQNSVVLDEQHATQMLKLMDLLEDHDDVQNVFSNFDIPEEVMQKVL